MKTMHDPLTDRLEIIGCGPGAWRLCDRHAPRNDARSVVAYIEQRGEVIEVVWLHWRHHTTQFARLDDVLRAAVEILREGDAHGPQRPFTIPHRPPPRH